ncbi:MAG: NTP transferase domain-containing protein [Labilithrix sp.]|nr:NTP transferase domain-containing protein [Labilithrix sp.]
MHPVAGIFVGGRASRMGGIAKGLLVAPDGEPIVARTRRILEEAGAVCVLVGAHPAYFQLGLEVVPDDPGAEGPLAGLLALLARAGDRPALAVACDMPLFGRAIVRRLLEAPLAPIVAPRRRAPELGRDVWEPLFARYDSAVVLSTARALAARGERKLQRLLDAAGAQPLALTPEEEATLTDWDTLPVAASRDTKEG